VNFVKGFVFIDCPEQYTRFVANKAFDEIENNQEIIFIIVKSDPRMNKLALNMQTMGKTVISIPFYQGRFNQWLELFNLSCAIYQNLSPSFEVRFNEIIKNSPEYKKTYDKMRVTSDLNTDYKNYRDKIEREMGVNPDLLMLVKREKPAFFILPSALLDSITDDVLQLADILNIPTLFLVAGWDNLSSKGLLYHKPTLIGVWGEQSAKHAHLIQKIPSDIIYSIGAPHFEKYYFLRDNATSTGIEEITSDNDRKIILFAGTVRAFDEISILQEIDDLITSGVLPPLLIIYRPHPYRDSRKFEDNFFDHLWRNVKMDPDIKEAYIKSHGKSISNEYNNINRMDYLANLYKNVDAVICPMSTVLLEGIIFGLPCLAISFGDNKHSWSIDKVAKMEHFKEFFLIQDIIVCKSKNTLISDIQQLLLKMGDKKISNNLKDNANYFVYHDNQSYSSRLNKLLEILFTKSGMTPRYNQISLKPGRTYWEVTVKMKIYQAIVYVSLKSKSFYRSTIKTIWK